MLVTLLILAALLLWGAVYMFVIRPKLVAFRYTAGIYARISAAEAGLWTRLALWLKGLKVMILGVVTSMVPLAGALYPQLTGVDWTVYFPSDRAKLIATTLGLIGIFAPMLMVILHNGALAAASAAEPQPIPPAAKD